MDESTHRPSFQAEPTVTTGTGNMPVANLRTRLTDHEPSWRMYLHAAISVKVALRGLAQAPPGRDGRMPGCDRFGHELPSVIDSRRPILQGIRKMRQDLTARISVIWRIAENRISALHVKAVMPTPGFDRPV